MPNVAAQQGWNAVGILESLCRQMALPPGTWRDRTAIIRIFETVEINFS